jgi:immunity protein 10 of polymorphic toxin system
MHLRRVTVATAYEDGVFTVGFADEDGVGALLFSRSDTIDEQDLLLGLDTYSISTEDGGTYYGGVKSAKLSGMDLELQLTTEAAAALGVSDDLRLRFEDRAEAEAARGGLRRVGVASIDA